MFFLAFAESIQLFPDGTLLIHVGLILLMIYVLNRTLYRPINQVLAARERNKGGRSSEAVEILKDVEAKEARYQKAMLDARTRGYALIEKEQKKAIAAREEKLKTAKAEAAARFESGRSEIEQQTAAARAEIGVEAEKMADRIAASILKS